MSLFNERVLMGRKESNQTKTNGSLMKVENIAECSPWSILQYIWPALRNNWSWKPIFGLIESGNFTQVLLYLLASWVIFHVLFCCLLLFFFKINFFQNFFQECHLSVKQIRSTSGLAFYRAWSLFFVFVALRPMSTAMVIAGRSVHLTTLFPGQAWASG